MGVVVGLWDEGMVVCSSMQRLAPLRFMLISFSGRIKQYQRDGIAYLQEEERILRDQLGDKRLRLTDDQRRRLAVKAKKLGRKAPAELDSRFTPITPLGWHRKLVAQKYDRSQRRGPGVHLVRSTFGAPRRISRTQVDSMPSSSEPELRRAPPE